MPVGFAAQSLVTLEQVMARLAATRSQEFRFTETAERALLAEPEIQRGTLIRVSPAHLLRVTDSPNLRVTESPKAQRMLLSGGRLRTAIGKAKAEDAGPENASFFREFARLFEGDLEALRERYQLDFTAREAAGREAGSREAGSWELALVPRAERVRELLARIVLRGDAQEGTAVVTEVELQEAGGDRVHLQLSPVESDRVWDAQQLQAHFESRTLP